MDPIRKESSCDSVFFCLDLSIILILGIQDYARNLCIMIASVHSSRMMLPVFSNTQKPSPSRLASDNLYGIPALNNILKYGVVNGLGYTDFRILVASGACERSTCFSCIYLLGSIPNPLDISVENGCAA